MPNRPKRWKTPDEIRRAYADGLPGAPADAAFREEQIEIGNFRLFGDVGSRIKGLHKERPRMLLYKALRKLDPGALGQESQDTGDCTSHGTRNSVDGTRAAQIEFGGQNERYNTRGATEYIYSGRGHRGAGMNPGRATRIVQKGQMLRLDYRDEGGPDLREYDAQIGMRNGGRGIPEEWKRIAADEARVTDWVSPTEAEEALDLMANLSCGHGGSQFGSSRKVGRDGLNRRTTSWNHDMAHCGYDVTGEFFREPVVFVPNSWGGWNEPNPVWMANQDVYGAWVPGMLVVPVDLWERVILKARESYYMVDVVGDAIEPASLADLGSIYMLAA